MMLKLRIENIGDIKITPDFWDCECERNYIHDKNQSVCGVCNTVADEQPNSRVDEVKDWLNSQK